MRYSDGFTTNLCCKYWVLGALLLFSIPSKAQIVSLGCQNSLSATIDLDRNNWANGSTSNHSEAYMMNFDLPPETDPCTKIEKLIITVTVNSEDISGIPAMCSFFDFFENMYLSSGSLSFGSASEVPFSNTQASSVSDYGPVIEILCTNQNIEFDGTFGYDIIPAIDNASGGCPNPQTMISDGDITVDYDVCVEAEIGPAGMASATAAALDMDVCLGDPISLDETDGNNTQWDWTTPSGGSLSGNNPTIDPSTAGDFGPYEVTVTDGNGCTATDIVTITMNPTPSAIAGATDLDVCPGQDIELEETAHTGPDWEWTTPSGASLSGSSPVIPNSTAGDLGLYTVTVTDGNGCTATSEVTIGADTPPPADADATLTAVCPGQDIELLETGGASNVNWEWEGPNGNVGSQQNPTIPNSNSGDLGTYIVTVTDASGCSSTDEVTITAAAAPDVDADAVDDELCPGQTLELLENEGNGGTYDWEGPDGWTGSGQNPMRPSIPPAGFGLYTVTVTDPSGCSSTSQVDINLADPPDVDATALDDTVCPGQDIELEEAEGDGMSYDWTGPNGWTGTGQFPTIPLSLIHI